MTDYEKQFRNFTGRIKFDDTPNHEHRDRLEQNLLVALARPTRQREKRLHIWRKIMKSRTIKSATVAAIIVLAFLLSWISLEPQATNNITSLTLLSRACAAESALFKGDDIVHIINQITVYPSSAYQESAQLLNKLAESTTESLQELQSINRDFLNSWAFGWLPVCSLKANGQLHTNEVKVSADSVKASIILDDIWYEPATGRFARVMKLDDSVIFANSFDGQFVHTSETDTAGPIRLTVEPITAEFTIPQNPAEFLGITAGIRSLISDETLQQPIQQVYQDQLEDSTKVHTYKVGFKDTSGDMRTYSLFKVRNDDGIIAEIEYILGDKVQLLIQRVLTESVDSPEISWNLSEIDQEIPMSDKAGAVIDSGVVQEDISVDEMLEEASFETYILGTDPSWTDERTILSISDPISPGHRMFVIIHEATDGRHVILAQSQTHNTYFASVLKQVQAHGETIDSTTFDNDCKLWLNTGGEKWWTDIALRCSGFKPAEDRQGYIVGMPSQTVVCIAVNGSISEQELRSLINSLIPADKYVPSPIQP
jgi:hypothetical protein